MRPFAYSSPTTLEGALERLNEGGRPLAGGTELLTVLQDGHRSVEELVNLKAIPGLDRIELTPDGLELGPLVTLARLERDEGVGRDYPALAQAAEAAASPQLRNAGTVGGNLLQEVRCWYYRGPFDCWLKGGETCYARQGDARHHAIFPQAPCIAVQPSDLAQPLVAYEAVLKVRGPGGEEERPLEEHFQPPVEGRRAHHALSARELIVGLRLPAPWPGEWAAYLKPMERAGWGFALASLAVRLQVEGGVIRRARVVLGGVASTPRRSRGAEEALEGARAGAGSFATAAQAALEGAEPQPTNRYKLALVRGLFLQAAERLGA